MVNINTSEVNQKIELWQMKNIENKLGEISREGKKIKDIWAKVILSHGTKK